MTWAINSGVAFLLVCHLSRQWFFANNFIPAIGVVCVLQCLPAPAPSLSGTLALESVQITVRDLNSQRRHPSETE
jgi:hypothetical protein